MAVSLTEWLGSRTAGQIAAILTTRPDATVPPVPRHLRELAERLEIFHSVAEAAHALPRPAIEVIEVLQLLGPGAGERAALAGWLGCATDDRGLATILDLLAARALVWPDGDQLRMAQPLYATFRHPLRLGPPAATLLSPYPAEHLRRIARALGEPAGGRKDALVERITGVLGNGDRVRALVATAGPGARAALARLAEDGPPVAEFNDWYGYYQYQPDPNLSWPAERGLVVTVPPGLPQLPREVGVALRGPDWRAPFTPDPPVPPLVEVAAAVVEREAAAAASAAVDQVTALLEAVAANPVAMLKTGGVGVRELRRLAKRIGVAEDIARLWLELAHQAELVGPVQDDPPQSGRPGAPAAATLLPTDGYDRWTGSQPADRLAALLPVWAALPVSPLLSPPAGDPKPPPALTRDHNGHVATAARSGVVAFAASLPAGHGLASESGLPAAVCWHSPLVLTPLPDSDEVIRAAAQEARLLGVIAHGVLTPLGRALAGMDLAAACRALLPTAVHQAIFQADLTAVVPGTPEGTLAELLDAAADRETRGGAVTWRFSAGSVRRALDAGHRAEQLLAGLRERAMGGSLPQPLEYLVADVARRHGAVRVRPVACVLRADDPALLAEIAGARALRSLELSVIAPTVLGSGAPVAETLAALRQAGYAPVGESTDGVPVVERAERRRARPPGRQPAPGRRRDGTGPAAPPDPTDPVALATALLAAPVPASTPAPAQRRDPELADLERRLLAQGFLALPDQDGELDVAAELELLAGHLAAGERRLLAHAIEHAHPVEISYTNAQGGHSQRVIEPLELDGPQLVAWCQLRDDERIFALHRISAVAPA